ncbi:phage distal tail protein [Streptosporangium sp. NPDC002721]|uniref:phage distal tail protein n=1 Tax=Streptosporangium sp. NPDC002721 TaxID=3366188 RepID=UPI0036C944F7
MISNSGTARTWTQRKVHPSYAGIAIYTALNPTALTGTTVSITSSTGGMKVFVVTGHHPSLYIGANGSGTSATNNVTINGYTSTGVGSRGFLAAIDWNGTGAPSSTDDDYPFFESGFLSGLATTKSANSGAAGTNVQFNLDAAGTGTADWNWVSLEILGASLEATITASSVDAAAEVPEPGLSSGQTVHAGTVGASASVPAVGISAGQTVHAGSVDAQASVPNPSVAAGAAELIEVSTVTASAEVPDPGITAISNATPAPASVTAQASVLLPDITADRQALIPAVPVDAQAFVPTVGVSVPILPGTSITRDGQVEWGYYTLWGWNAYSVREITGWVDQKPQLDDLSVEEAFRHGALAGTSYAKRRVVTIKLQVNSLSDPTQISALLRQLRYDTRTLRDNTLWPLVIRGRTETLLAYGKVIDRTGVMDADWSIGSTEPVITIMCPDPRCYSLEQQSTVIAAGETATLANDGDVYTSPILRFTGPATNPAVLNETLDRVLAFNITLTSGQRLDVDTQRGKVLLGDVNRMSALADDISVPVKEWFLDTGSSVITYETDSGGTAGVEIIHRSATM